MFDELFGAEPNTLGPVDWRKPENRLEAFSRIIHARMAEGDLDHHHSGKVIASQMNLDDDNKVLYSLLFGQSYRNHWAMIVLQLFPDILTMPESSLRDWHAKNWQRMKFGKDTKWNVRKFPDFIMSLRSTLRGAKPYEFFGNLANSAGNTKQNYTHLNEGLRSLYSIGRMTAWLAQQTLYEFFHWDIDHWDQQLYDDGTWSQYDSLCYIFDRLDIARSQKTDDGIVKYKPCKADIDLMSDKTIELMEYVNRRIPFHVDIYNVESAECEFRKTAYGPRIKEFTFWTTNELAEQYAELKSLWADYPGAVKPDWKPYVIGLMTKGSCVRKFGFDESYFRVFVDHGLNLNTDIVYRDEPDAHKILNLPKRISPQMHELYADWADINDHDMLIEAYDPRKFLVYKESLHPAWQDEAVRPDCLDGYRCFIDHSDS